MPVFVLVMLGAARVHLDASRRTRAMPDVALLVASGGTVIFQLHVRRGRRMVEVSAEQTIALARQKGRPVLNAPTLEPLPKIARPV